MSNVLPFALALTLATPVTSFGKTGRYDASGAPGIADDPAERSFEPGENAFPLFPGKRGGDAQEPTVSDGTLRKQGRPAGTIVLNLEASSDATEITVNGTVEHKLIGTRTEPERRRTVTVRDSFLLSPKTSFELIAEGGPGGDGGAGGRGQDGGMGAKGSPAAYDPVFKVVTPAGPGGIGAPGGNEGRSSDGGDAGPGGLIRVRVDRKNMDLSMLLDLINVNGNRGGRPGVGRGPGEGGPGGPGGDGLRYLYEGTRDIIGKDEQGNDKVLGQEPFSEYRTIPSGWPGPQGISGQPHGYEPKHGKASRPGKFLYEVKGADGEWRVYEGLSRLSLLPGYTLVGSLNGRYVAKKRPGDRTTTEFFEPGEPITITGLRIINSGDAPTPEVQKIRLFLSDTDEWIVSDGLELVVPHSLAPGEEYSFGDQPLTFYLRERVRDAEGPLRGHDVLSPHAKVDRVEREYVNFATDKSAQTNLRVQYPIEINVMENLVTIAPGEAQELTWSVKNVSNQTLGKSINFKNLRLAHTVYRRSQGTLEENAFVMAGFKQDDYVVPTEGVLRALENLGPGQEAFINTYVGFRGNAEHYTNVTIQPEVFLELIRKPGQVVRIEYKPHTITVAKPYEYHENADVLIIANHGLDARALKALKAAGSFMRLRFDIWDYSYYGFFDWIGRVADYDPNAKHLGATNFFEAYRGKTIVVLGNDIRTPLGHLRTPELLSPERIVEAARRYGIKLVIMDTSGDADHTLAQLVEPVPLPNPQPGEVKTYTDLKHYRRETRSGLQRPQDDQGREAEFLGVHRIPVRRTQWLPWVFKPTEEFLAAQETKAVKLTDRRLPETKPHADRAHNVVDLEPLLKIFPRREVGSVDVRFATDDAKTSLVVIPMPAQELNNPDFIVSRQFQNAMYMGLNFDKKIDLFNSIMLGRFNDDVDEFKIPPEFAHIPTLTPLEYAGVLVYSLLLDILNEQQKIRPLEHGIDVPLKEMRQKLASLRKLAYADYSQFALDPDTPEGKLFVQLIVAIRYYNKAITTPMQRWFSAYQSKNIQISRTTASMLEYLVEHVFKDHENAFKVIEESLKQVRADAKARGIARADIIEYLDPYNYRAYLRRDADVLQGLGDRVRGPRETQARLNDVERRNDRREEVAKAIAADNLRMRLKSGGECESFLAGQVVSPSGPQTKEMIYVHADPLPKPSPARVPRVPR